MCHSNANNEKCIQYFKKIITSSASAQENQEFKQMLLQIAKEGCDGIKSNPVYEAIEILDDFLEELDEFYGLAALKYGSEAYDAMEVLRSWYYKQRDTNKTVYILVQRLNSEKKGEVDKDIIMAVYKTEESAIAAREYEEKRNKEFWTGDGVYEVKPYILQE